MTSIGGRQGKSLISRTNESRGFVAAQVADGHFAAHEPARAGYSDTLCHCGVCFQFLLHDSFHFRRGKFKQTEISLRCCATCEHGTKTTQRRGCHGGIYKKIVFALQSTVAAPSKAQRSQFQERTPRDALDYSIVAASWQEAIFVLARTGATSASRAA